MSEERRFIIGPGPHVRAAETTPRIMWQVNAALAPAALWGMFSFGPHAVLVILASIVGAVGAEALVARMNRRPTTVRDGSAFCTGLLLALTLPPLVAPWQAALGGAFSIVVGKSIFGGLGFNLFNPALIGRAFMLATFPQPLTMGWELPHLGRAMPLDATTTPTPLALLREQGLDAALAVVHGPDGPWLNLLLGFRPGCIGETSVVLLALGAAYLLARRIIRITIPLAVFAGVFVTTVWTGFPILHLLTGGLWLGAFFMATDYVTSPTTREGQIVFGLAAGALTGLIRMFGGYPEGVCYAILLANTLTPALNSWFRPRRTAPAEALS